MYPDPNNPSQPGQANSQPAAQPDPHMPQSLPQYPSPYPPVMGSQSWQQPRNQYEQADPTPQLPQPQRPGSVPATPAPSYAPPAAPTPPAYAPRQSAPVPSSGGDGSKAKAVVVAIVVVIVLLGLSVGAYFLMNALNSSDKTPAPTPPASQQQEQKTTKAELASLQDLTLLPPNDLSRYTPNAENTEFVMAYNTEGDGCSLQLGVVDAETLPGKDFQDIVERQIIALKDQGVKVDGPTKGDALNLTDVSDKSKQYTIPTVTFVATDSANKQVRSHYSAAILKSGKRAYIMRTCQVANGTVDEQAVRPLDDDAKQITVQAR